MIYELLKDFISILFEIISGLSSLAQAGTCFTGEKAQKIPTLNLRLWGTEN
jgi:hypothetical protein